MTAVVLQKPGERFGRSAVVIRKVACDQREIGILCGGENVCFDRVSIDTAITTRDELNRVGGLCRHRPKAMLFSRITDAKGVFGSRFQAGQFATKDFLVGIRVRFCDDVRCRP